MSIELSVEFFPPQTPEGADKLRTVWTKLAPLKPAFCSVTFGAGGSTQDRTFETVEEIRAAGLPAAPHLSCIGSTKARVREILERYRAVGIHRIVALRGDLPSGMAEPGELRHANELVEFIRQETGDWFHIEVAAYPEYHPQAKSPKDDLANFKRKAEAGADAAITQFFYNADAYEHFVADARAAGVTIPIIPGIMPVASFSKLSRFADTCGAEIPRWMRKHFESYGDDAASIRAYGLDVVTQLCERLIKSGAPGLHFYTLNQAGLTTEIIRRLGI
ncbi:MAG: methylenetetrahydrofolate reductase [NAD(P)H] [Rhodocyclales bacterium]|nr:methylenetetrahydrofolate reductase [NAD(P)H] [Rhodocyclales bacterium]